MTLYDRQTLKVVAILVVRRRTQAARRRLKTLSVQGQSTPEYEDISSALAISERMPRLREIRLEKPVCQNEALGCWWHCPRPRRRQCSLNLRVFGVNAGE